MAYKCDHCDNPLSSGATACPKCGEKLDEAVPVPKEAGSVDAILNARTAGGRPQEAKPAASAPLASDAFPQTTFPLRKKKVPVWLGLTIAAFLLMCPVLAGWAGYSLWMRGQGGEIAFRQHNRVGNQAFEDHDFGKAAEEYGQMIALRPRRMDGYLLRGMAYHALGRYREAIADDTAALALPDARMGGADLYSNRAGAEAKIGQYPAAIRDLTQGLLLYQRVRRVDSGTHIFGYLRSDYQERAAAYAALHQYALAAADYDTVIRSYAPGSSDFALRGAARAALGKNDAALADYEQVIRLDPDNPDSYLEESDFLERRHQYTQAIALWQRARQVFGKDSPNNGRWWGNLGWLQFQSGQAAEATRSDQKALEADRDQGWVRYNLGLCYAVQGDGASATAAYTEGLAHSSESLRQAALKDIRDTLAKQPHSIPLQQAQQQLVQGQVRQTPFPPQARPQIASRVSTPKTALGISSSVRPPNGIGAEVVIGAYAISPPAGYVLKQTSIDTAEGSEVICLWTGPQRSDGTAPTLGVEIGKGGGSIADENTSDWAAQMVLSVNRARHKNFVPSPLEHMALSGLMFTHAGWKGIGQQTGKEFEGNVYATVTAGTTIRLLSHDATPYSHATLPLIQKSILTFRRQ